MNLTKRSHFIYLLASSIVASSLAGMSLAQEKKPAEPKPKPKPATSLPKFKTPPGKAKRKTSAGTRSGDNPVLVAAVTPSTFGLTTSAQPAMFWHQSDSSKPKQLVFSIHEDGVRKILAKVVLPKAYPKGINRIDLSDLKVNLTPGKSYNWSITYITSRKSPSLNGVGKGTIKYEKPSSAQLAKLEGASADQRVLIHSESGAWHDLLAALDDLIKQDSKNGALRHDLLRQVGLGDLVN